MIFPTYDTPDIAARLAGRHLRYAIASDRLGSFNVRSAELNFRARTDKPSVQPRVRVNTKTDSDRITIIWNRLGGKLGKECGYTARHIPAVGLKAIANTETQIVRKYENPNASGGYLIQSTKRFVINEDVRMDISANLTFVNDITKACAIGVKPT